MNAQSHHPSPSPSPSTSLFFLPPSRTTTSFHESSQRSSLQTHPPPWVSGLGVIPPARLNIIQDRYGNDISVSIRASQQLQKSWVGNMYSSLGYTKYSTYSHQAAGGRAGDRKKRPHNKNKIKYFNERSRNENLEP